jgi:hypothetical protein
VELARLESRIAALDAALRPIAQRPIDTSDPGWVEAMRAAPPPTVQAGVDDEAQAVLRELIDGYATGDADTREAIRGLFERYSSFRWAVHFPRPVDTAEAFRAHLLHLSARDQVPDTRDELLTLRDLCEAAVAAGVDTAPILSEVAAISADHDRYGMGTTRDIILSCVRPVGPVRPPRRRRS